MTPNEAMKPEKAGQVYLRSYLENRHQRKEYAKKLEPQLLQPQQQLYPRKQPRKQPKKPVFRFRIREMVRFRLERTKDPFRKGFHPQFSSTIYVVCVRYPTTPPTYAICELPTAKKNPNKQLDEKFYEPELVRVTEAQNSAPPLPPIPEEAAAEDEAEEGEEAEEEPPPPPIHIRRPFLPRRVKEQRRTFFGFD